MQFMDYLVRHYTCVLHITPDDKDSLVQRIREELDSNSSLTHTQRKEYVQLLEKLLAAN